MQDLKRLSSFGVAFKSFTEQHLDGTGIFKDAIIGILGALAHQERVRLSKRVVAGLERARKQGRVGGRPKVRRERDKDAKRIRQLREDDQSYREIADELGRTKSDIASICQSLGCASQAASPAAMIC